MKIKGKSEDWSKLTPRQRLGYWLIRFLGALQQWVHVRVLREFVWRTADGKCIPLSGMADSHLYNSLAMVRRRGDQPDLIALLQAEVARRVVKP